MPVTYYKRNDKMISLMETNTHIEDDTLLYFVAICSAAGVHLFPSHLGHQLAGYDHLWQSHTGDDWSEADPHARTMTSGEIRRLKESMAAAGWREVQHGER